MDLHVFWVVHGSGQREIFEVTTKESCTVPCIWYETVGQEFCVLHMLCWCWKELLFDNWVDCIRVSNTMYVTCWYVPDVINISYIHSTQHPILVHSLSRISISPLETYTKPTYYLYFIVYVIYTYSKDIIRHMIESYIFKICQVINICT